MIGQNIALLRKRNNITQARLAECLGVWQTNISRIERGQSDVSVEMAIRIADLLGVSVNELVTPATQPAETAAERVPA